MEFKTGILVGRFQPVHNGHEKLINIALSLCDRVLVFVSSSDKISFERNPYTAEYRIRLISKIYDKEIKSGRLILKPLSDLTTESDLTPKWGEYVISSAEEILKENVNVIIYGKDKDIRKCFPINIVENIAEVFVDRKSLNISATKVREMLMENKKEEFYKYTNKAIHNEYNNLRNILTDLERSSENGK